MKIGLATAIVLVVIIVGVAALCWRSWRKYRRALAEDRAELHKAVWDVVNDLSQVREPLLERILERDFVETVDGREQRFACMKLDEFYLYVSKETKRPRVWVKIRKGENYTQIVCRSTSKLGKAVVSLFLLIDQLSKPPSEGVKQAMREHLQILHEIGASERVITNAEKTAEAHGVSIPKPDK